MNTKTRLLISTIVVLVVLTILAIEIGMNKKNDNNKKESKDSTEWKLVMNDEERMFEEDEKTAFDNAMQEYKDSELTPLAVLATQVVSGTNYMFFCKEKINEEEGYVVVIIYKDLQGNSKLTHISEFNINNYVDRDNEFNAKELVGGWQVEIPGKPYMLEEDIQASFDKADVKIGEISYYPILTVGKNNKKYGILSYGRINDETKTEGVFVLTLNTKTNKFDTTYALDLGDFNQ